MGNKVNDKDNNEEIVIEDVDLNDNLVDEIEDKKVLSKNEHAKKLIDESKEIIYAVDNDVYEAKSVVYENIDALKEVKSELTDVTIAHSRVLLERVKHPYTEDDDFTPFELEMVESPSEVKVKNIGSGWFSGFILAILGMIVTAIGWLFVSSKMTEEPLPSPLDKLATLDKLPTLEELPKLDTIFTVDNIPSDKMFAWIGDNAQIGMAVMGITTLLIGYLIYKIRTSLKQSKNLKSANRVFEESNLYAETQKELKSDLMRIDEHIKTVTPLVGNYKVILDEQNAKLERIIHIEGELQEHAQYQRASQEIMSDTEKLMESVERLISTPITQEGKLNELSENALIDTKVLYESYLSKLYA